MKLLITGGHVTPALAIIDELLKKKADVNLFFVGRKYALSKDSGVTFEYHEVTQREIPFLNLNASRFHLLSFFNIIGTIFNAHKILSKKKPDAVLTFGSYVGFPVAIASKLLGIPVYVHEQTIHPGTVNRLIGLIAKKIFISFEETRRFFPGKKTVLSGNPLRPSLFQIHKKSFVLPKNYPVIYITGGSLGSHSINEHIKKILLRLLEKYAVIHQTGNVKEYSDNEFFSHFKKDLSPDVKKRYIVEPHFFSDEIGYIYSLADMIITRSGANTFFELITLQKPSVLIPLPWSAYQEQKKQADILKKGGVAEVFDQKNSSEELLQLIEKMMQNIGSYRKSFSALPYTYTQYANATVIKEILRQ